MIPKNDSPAPLHGDSPVLSPRLMVSLGLSTLVPVLWYCTYRTWVPVYVQDLGARVPGPPPDPWRAGTMVLRRSYGTSTTASAPASGSGPSGSGLEVHAGALCGAYQVTPSGSGLEVRALCGGSGLEVRRPRFLDSHKRSRNRVNRR